MTEFVYQIGGRYQSFVGDPAQQNTLHIYGNDRFDNYIKVGVLQSNVPGIGEKGTILGLSDTQDILFSAKNIQKGLVFHGSNKNDTYDASAFYGNSVFHGSAGNDYFAGGHGKNTFYHDYDDNGVSHIVGGTSATIISFPIVNVFTASNNVRVDGTSGDDIFDLSGSANRLKIHDGSRTVVEATKLGANHSVVIDAGSGDDLVDVTSYTGKITANGGAGDDTFVAQLGVTGTGTAFTGGSGSNTVIVYADQDTMLYVDYESGWYIFRNEDGSSWFKARDIDTIELRDADDLTGGSAARLLGVGEWASAAVAEIA